jgi:type II secretory pathway pseudopilin PulG
MIAFSLSRRHQPPLTMKTLVIISFLAACFVSVARSDVQKALDAQKRGDYETARQEFQALADKGDDKAMINLGVMYHTGEGAKQDYAKAMDWYLKAYAKQNGDAQNNIGVMYRDGLGVTTNAKIAYLLFLAVHMESLGNEATQIRAGRNLSRLAQSLPKKDAEEALSYTWAYVDQIVKSRGKNVAIGKDVLPAKKRPRIRDNNWWLDSERKKMDFESPSPWNVKGG